MKKPLSIVLSLLMMLTAITALPFTASALDASGTVNGNISYAFDSATGVLTLTGTGEIPTIDTFKGNKSITKIIIGEGITKVNYNVFNNCSNVTELSLPSTLKRICGYAFGSLAITEINLPDGIEAVESSGFGYCDKVTSITIPASVSYLVGSSFDTTKVTSFTLSADNPYFETIDGNLFNEDKTTLIEYCGGKDATEYTVPDGVLHISSYAFSTTPKIKKVILPEGMTIVDDCAFRSCSFLEEIVLPSTITVIDTGAFTYCNVLSNITLPEGLTTIDNRAFESCSNLGELTLPKSVTNVNSEAFYNAKNITLKVLNPECVFADSANLFSSGKFVAAEKCDGTCSAKAYAQKYEITYETLSVEEHSYETVSETPATCTVAGSKSLKCSACGFETEETINALGHDMEIEEFGAEATCTEDGFLPYCHCTRCDKYFIDSEGANPIEGIPVIPAKGHAWNAGAVTKKATVKAAGVKTYTCTACKATKTEAIAKNNFTVKAKKATVKYSKLSAKNQTVKRAKAVTVKNAKGKVSYKIAKKNKNFTVAKNGKITVKKGLKKGTYKIKIKVTAAGNADYAKAAKTVTVTIVVK